MAFKSRTAYKDLTDKEIVEMILAIPHNEEAAAFLLYNRYDPLLHKIYRDITREIYWFDDCVVELFIHLKGKDCNWQPVASFEWRSTFGCWLKKVARQKFLETLPKLIENNGNNLSIDDDDPEKPKVQLPNGGEEEYERRQRKVMLMEAIGLLKDEDQRFVILKRLEGYNSEETALLLQKKWQKLGIKKYGHKKGSNEKELVIPSAAYVNVHIQRAKDNLRKLIIEIK